MTMMSAARRSAVNFPPELARADDIQDVGSSIGVAHWAREEINVVAVRPEIEASSATATALQSAR
jgi:hypothetical protein